MSPTSQDSLDCNVPTCSAPGSRASQQAPQVSGEDVQTTDGNAVVPQQAYAAARMLGL